MTNFSKFFSEVVITTSRIEEAKQHHDAETQSYYAGRLEALRWIIENDMLDTKK